MFLMGSLCLSLFYDSPFSFISSPQHCHGCLTQDLEWGNLLAGLYRKEKVSI